MASLSYQPPPPPRPFLHCKLKSSSSSSSASTPVNCQTGAIPPPHLFPSQSSAHHHHDSSSSSNNSNPSSLTGFSSPEKWRARMSFFPAFLNKGKDLGSLKEELLDAIAPLDRGAEASPDDQRSVDQIAH